MKNTDRTDGILTEYLIDKKYYCSKCKFFIDKVCTKNRITKECRKERLRNV